MLDDATRSRIATASGRAGGLSNVAKNGRHNVARGARAGFMARFEKQVDPDGVLTPEERADRARSALKAHMAKLSMRSAASRRKVS